MGSAGSRENPADIGGMALGWGGTVPPGAVARHLRYHAGQQAAPASPTYGLLNVTTAMDELAPAGRCRQFR